MKIRTIYFKVTNMTEAVAFWQGLLQIEPHRAFPEWHEFMVQGLRLGLWLNTIGDQYAGANCVPVFEFSDEELPSYIERAQALGATVIEDGLENPKLLSVVFADPFGNQFELSKFHE